MFFCYLKFCPDFLILKKNDLIGNIRLISEFMTSKPEKQAIAVHILTNFSRSRGYQTIKFGQLIEYNTRNIFLEKSYI